MTSEAERHVWQDLGACITQPPDVFFPGDGDYDAARKICAVCVVRETCLEYALANNLKDGMWGGESPEQRKRIKRRRRWLARQQREQQGEQQGEGDRHGEA